MLQNLQYHLLPGRCPAGFRGTEFHNQVFHYWKNFWDGVLKDLDGTQANVADFDRQSLIAAITAPGGQIVAIHLYTFFNAHSEAFKTHPYVKNSFEDDYVDWIIKNKLEAPMTMEYLTINPAFRKKEVGVSMAYVLMGLGMKLMESLNASAAIGPCRQDVKVDKIAFDYGAIGLEPRIMHNVPVVSVAIPAKNHPPCPFPEERALIDRMWETKSYWTQVDSFHIQNPSKEAA